VLHRSYFLTLLVNVFSRRFVADELLTCDGMLALREPLEVFLADGAAQSPLLGEFPMPFPAYLVAFCVVILASVAELLRVVCLRLACTQGIGNGQHVC
jgi:hypothetical protein